MGFCYSVIGIILLPVILAHFTGKSSRFDGFYGLCWVVTEFSFSGHCAPFHVTISATLCSSVVCL